VDFDRCDFVLRDARQTGVAYGRYDLNWLISTVAVGQTSGGKLVVGFDRRKAPRVVEQLLVARRAMYDTVYYHKTVRSAEGMIGLLLRRIKQIVREKGWIFGDAEFFSSFKKILEGTSLDPAAVLDLDDYSLWVFIQKLASMADKDVTVSDLARRIITRDLFKLVPCEQSRLENFLDIDDARPRLYYAVRPFCPGMEEYYIHIDRARFDMFSESEREQAYFVDVDSEARDATLIRDHPKLRPHWAESQTLVRLFAPREAVEAIRKVIEKS